MLDYIGRRRRQPGVGRARAAGGRRPAGGVPARRLLAVHGHAPRQAAAGGAVAGGPGTLEGGGMSGFWRDRPTLVTGATGLVGGWVVRRLLRQQADVVCLVRDWVPESEVVRGRAAGPGEDRPRRRARPGDCWSGCSASTRSTPSSTSRRRRSCPSRTATRSPRSRRNIAGTWALLEACRRSPKVRQIVLASSDKAYGDAEQLPYDETTPLCGRHPYDVSKSCADLIAQSYAATYGSPVAITRCGNFYGPGDLNWNRIVPGTIRSVVRGERPVIRSDGQTSATTSTSRTAPPRTCCSPRSWPPTRRCAARRSTSPTRRRSRCWSWCGSCST